MYIIKCISWLVISCIVGAKLSIAASVTVTVPESVSAPKVELGRYLFNDVRLSKFGNRSCALCHSPYHGWSNTFSKTPDIHGNISTLNTPSLLNAADFTTYMQASRDLTDLAETIKRPLLSTSPEEMGMLEPLLISRLQRSSSLYAPLFIRAFGSSTVTLDKVLLALAEYVKTIRSTDTPYHRYLEQADINPLTPAQQKGLVLFKSKRLNCTACHSGVLLDRRTDARKTNFANTGLYGIESERGYIYPPAASGLQSTSGRIEDNGKFRIPSLINVTATGPWGHDGSFSTLGAVIDSYARGGRLTVSGPNQGDGNKHPKKDRLITGFSLTQLEKSQLLGFLAALAIPVPAQLIQHASPFCALVTLPGRVDVADCILPFIYRGSENTD
ncbi:cytochrome-c peroxidase [Moritella marina ATCC 15381]|uniref:Cytochrome-c peroxidase n=1 Tax=Moritella marina ATCC 15381 TaxID=1202962 RepID=A0A5J6WNR5_MORMI|nr:cytochrome c peroxidase [Moritella marina]QFI38818.1 cytochrome-c peroxidase [Moritella marina ATCC 15381]